MEEKEDTGLKDKRYVNLVYKVVTKLTYLFVFEK